VHPSFLCCILLRFLSAPLSYNIWIHCVVFLFHVICSVYVAVVLNSVTRPKLSWRATRKYTYERDNFLYQYDFWTVPVVWCMFYMNDVSSVGCTFIILILVAAVDIEPGTFWMLG
jgi:hypothetical protein